MPHAVVIQPPLRLSRDFIDYPYHCDLAVAQAAAVLRAAGWDVEVLDAFAQAESRVDASADGDLLLGAPVDALLASVDETDLWVVALAPFHRPPARDPTLGELLAGLRRRAVDTPLLLADLYQSGQHYLAAPGADVLASYPEADLLLQHEAESVLADTAGGLVRAGRPAERRALDGGETDDLDALPLPAWDLVDLRARDAFFQRLIRDLGRSEWAFPIDGRTLPAVTSRGCPYRCAHCSSNPGRGSRPKTQRRLSANRMQELVTWLVERGATRVAFLDEMVNASTEHFDSLLDAMETSGLSFDFPNGMRADAVDRRHLERMRGRIRTLSISAESGVQRVVDEVVGKRLELGSVDRTVETARELGLSTLVHFIIGNPGETRTEINQTLEYALGLHERFGAWPAVQFATPLPGTRLAEVSAHAADGALPVVRDFGPAFQHQPLTRSDEFDPETLRAFKWTFEQRLAAGRQPHKLILNVTYRCNNHCAFCAVGNRVQLDGRLGEQMQTLERYRADGIEMVDFDGGEPTLYDGLFALIEHARAIGYRAINVTTNGRRCFYPTFASRLVRSGITTLLFSLHGPDAETHAANTGVAESFEQTTIGIRNCVNRCPPEVELGLNVTVTEQNYRTLPELAQLAWDLGLRWMNIQFLTPFGRATRALGPDAEAANAMVARVLDAWRDRMRLQVVNAPFCQLPGYEDLLLGDLLKIQRHMVFVNDQQVNLYDYLETQRHYAEECHGCPHKVFCGGFYELGDAAEPPWVPSAPAG